MYEIPRVRANRAPTQPIQLEEFIAWQDDNGRMLLPESECRRRIFQRGLAVSARKDIWLFLLGVYRWDSDRLEREHKLNLMKLVLVWFTAYLQVTRSRVFNELCLIENNMRHSRKAGKRMNPASKRQLAFVKKLTELVSDTPFTILFRHKWTPQAHPTDGHHAGFKFSSDIDCRRTDRQQSYFAIPPDLSSVDDILEPLDEGSNMPSTNRHVESLGRILMTYNVWEKDLGWAFFSVCTLSPELRMCWIWSSLSMLTGYVQGMSDLCAPLYVVFEADQAVTFFAFVKLMDRMVSKLVLSYFSPHPVSSSNTKFPNLTTYFLLIILRNTIS